MMESPFKGKTGIRRILNAAGYSIDGLRATLQVEAAFRQVSLLALIGIALAIWLPLPNWGRALVIFAHLLCMVIELLNSAIEAAVDHTSLERHPLAKRAKDAGSAAQMIGLLNLALIWLLAWLAR